MSVVPRRWSHLLRKNEPGRDAEDGEVDKRADEQCARGELECRGGTRVESGDKGVLDGAEGATEQHERHQREEELLVRAEICVPEQQVHPAEHEHEHGDVAERRDDGVAGFGDKRCRVVRARRTVHAAGLDCLALFGESHVTLDAVCVGVDWSPEVLPDKPPVDALGERDCGTGHREHTRDEGRHPRQFGADSVPLEQLHTRISGLLPN